MSLPLVFKGNHLLVCGARESGKKHVVRELCGDSAKLTKLSEDTHHCEFAISNKYYTASVHVSVVSTSAAVSQLLSAKLMCSAVVIVVDLCQSKSGIFEELTVWLASLSPILQRGDCDSCVVFGNYCAPLPTDSRTKLEYSLLEWVLDNGFEFIPNPFGFGGDSDSGSGVALDGRYEDDEDVGTKRLSAALDCVRWPNLQMKARKLPGASHTVIDDCAADTGALVTTTESGDSEVKAIASKEIEHSVIGSEVTAELSDACDKGSDEKEEVSGDQETEEKSEEMVEVSGSEMSGVDTSEIRGKTEERRSAEDAKSQEIESAMKKKMKKKKKKKKRDSTPPMTFESLMDEMHTVRQMATSGSLTDEQRRLNAERTMAKFMSFMGSMDDVPFP